MFHTSAVPQVPSSLPQIEAVEASDVTVSVRQVKAYAKPYRELLTRSEQGQRLVQMLTGLTSDLERKSIEPIAVMHGVPRRGLQRFVGENGWSHRPLLQRQWAEVAEEIGSPTASIVVDGSSTPKKGDDTVGVARQWCGRLGKVDNCVTGVHAAYVGRNELTTLVASDIYLPRAWLEDSSRREQAYIPATTAYRSQAKIAGDVIADLAPHLPFEWVLGDDEFGRSKELRDRVAGLNKSYVFDVPSNTSVRRVTKWGRPGPASFTVERLTRRTPVADWKYFKVRDGEKGPIEVRAFCAKVVTRRDDGAWTPETLLVIETLDASQRWYCLARSTSDTSLQELVRQAGTRHRIEEVFEEAKGEVGLDHFEVRAWHGWQHHMLLCQLAHWFLVREKRRLGKKSAGHHPQPDSSGDRSAARTETVGPEKRGIHQLPSRSERSGAGVAVSSARPCSTATSPHGLMGAWMHPAQ